MARGRLRVYLGAAPGVGKTFAMLSEGRRRAERGTDVVVGVVEDHGRPRTRALLEGLEVVPRRVVVHRGSRLSEMDVDAVVARRPQVVLVDELAHTNAPGSRHDKRWQDVEALLDAGIDVISTVNVQHLASLTDVVRSVTGASQRETVPDEMVRRADQVELVDMTPEALRRRMAHGNVYPPERVDAALGNYFRVGNLTALRELALLWLADKVDEGMQDYRKAHGIDTTWDTRERVVVALSGGAEGATLIRRAARIAARQTGGDLLAVHVARADGLAGAGADQLAEQRTLVEQLGGSYHVVVGDDVTRSLLEFARAENATQLVLGASRRGRLAALLGPGIGQSVVRHSGSIDVHLVTHERVGRGRALPAPSTGLSGRRRVLGIALALAGLPALTAALLPVRDELSLGSVLLLTLTGVVAVALVGGLVPAVLAACAGSLLVNWFFTPPFGTLTIADAEDVLALGVFAVVAVAVALVVDRAARRAREAARAGSEAQVLATLSGDVLRGERTLPALLERTRELFGLEGAEIVEDGRVVASAGSPGEPVLELPLAVGSALRLTGRPLPAGDRRVLGAIAAQAAASLERGKLKQQASEAQRLSELDSVRTALLAAVGHDLRSPLAAAKACITSLRSEDVAFSDDDRAELLEAADESLDVLDDVVADLLDMTRLQTGALPVRPHRVSLADTLSLALLRTPDRGARVRLEVPDALPDLLIDAGLLERVVVNTVENALRHSPSDREVRLSAELHDEEVHVRVSDHGPGIPDVDKEAAFTPFQRLHDRAHPGSGTGVGLGLAVSRGFAEAMGGSLVAEDTPGGGLTLHLRLPARRP